jgi:hypothetical protein
MGICPKKFGPYYWGTLHLACLYAADTGAVKALVDSYTRTLPCPACRIHFDQVLQEFPFPHDGTRQDIFAWSVKVHNIVNARLGKPQVTIDEALDFWTSGCNGDEDPIFDWKFWGASGALIILIVFLVRKNR